MIITITECGMDRLFRYSADKKFQQSGLSARIFQTLPS
jgi:hypothetical protein